MKKQLKKTTLVCGALLMTACASADNPATATVALSDCAIQETIPGSKATGAFLTMTKSGDAPLALVSAKAPTVTEHVELHEMMMKDNKMIMSEINEFPLQTGDNLFKKGGYHIMLMSLEKTLKAGDHHDLTLTFSDGSTQTCHAEVKTVKALTPKGMKPMNHDHSHHDHSDGDHSHAHN